MVGSFRSRPLDTKYTPPKACKAMRPAASRSQGAGLARAARISILVTRIGLVLGKPVADVVPGHLAAHEDVGHRLRLEPGVERRRHHVDRFRLASDRAGG